MKDSKRKKTLSVVLSIFIGIGIGVLLGLWFFSESCDIDAVIVVLLLAAFSITGITICIVIDTLIAPFLSRRRAAIRALGREGMRLVYKDSVARLAYKGIYEIMKGDYPKAEDYLQQSLAQADIRQNQLFCVEWLIRLYEAIENDSKLAWGYRKAVELSPDNPEAQSRLGHYYYKVGQLDKAEYCFEQSLRYDANNGYAYFSLSNIYLLRGEDDRAFDALQKLKKVNEQHPLCHSAFAEYYAMKGDRENAEEECKKAELCGISNPEELNKRINAMLSFHTTEFSEEDLPSAFYRRIEKRNENTENEKQ